GEVEQVSNDRYKINGKIHQINNASVRITELSIRVWTQNYKETLELWISGTDKVPKLDPRTLNIQARILEEEGLSRIEAIVLLESDGFEIFTDDKDNDEYDKDDKDATDMCLLIIMDMVI
ncbi:14888_t:CDS:2, partial [Funneliformis mosseae]